MAPSANRWHIAPSANRWHLGSISQFETITYMELSRIEETVQLLQVIGFTLNVEERLRLKLAHVALQSAFPDIDQFKFWGRIQGLAKSYYILVGLRFCKSYEFPHKQFFYSLSGDLDFKELPQLLLQHEGFSEKYNAMPFMGDPSKILINLEGEAEGQQPPAAEQGQAENKPAEDEDDQAKKVPKKNFTELHRLSYVVRAVQHDVQVVPRDSFRVTPEHELRPNLNFYGLQATNGGLPVSWQHFRPPLTVQARKNMEDDMVVFSTGFLDTLEQDKPQGSWALQIDSRIKNATAKSFLWPGYFAFHRLGSELFGSAYIGDGTKNVDLPFMI